MAKCSAENISLIAAANNQLSGYGYDAAGNMTSNPTDGVAATYDAENRISTATKGGATTTYVYDADGNRVEKSNGTGPSGGTLYWYMTPGIVAESDLAGNLQSEYVFFDGQRIARKDFPSNAVSYYFSDHLKTTDIVTDAAGNIKNESDYYPWGGELSFLANDSNHYKFTGKERDSETQLDYFGARYYSNGLGRFVSADWSATPVPVPYADFGDPQSLNQYSYVRNIPTSKTDLDGHCPECIELGEEVVEFVVEHPQAAGTVAAAAEKTGEAIATGVETAGVTAGRMLLGAVGLLVFSSTRGGDPHESDYLPHSSQGQQTQQQTQHGQTQTEEPPPATPPTPAAGGAGQRGNGRGGKQTRLRELGKDDKVSSSDRGEIRRDQNQIARGTRSTLRVPGNKDLAHRRGQEARKGYSYKHSDLQNKDLHRLQHKHEGYQ